MKTKCCQQNGSNCDSTRDMGINWFRPIGCICTVALCHLLVENKPKIKVFMLTICSTVAVKATNAFRN